MRGIGAAAGRRRRGRRVVERGHDGGPGDDGGQEAQQNGHCDKDTTPSQSAPTRVRWGVNGNVRSVVSCVSSHRPSDSRRRRAPTLPNSGCAAAHLWCGRATQSAWVSAAVQEPTPVRAPHGCGRRGLRPGVRVGFRLRRRRWLLLGSQTSVLEVPRLVVDTDRAARFDTCALGGFGGSAPREPGGCPPRELDGCADRARGGLRGARELVGCAALVLDCLRGERIGRLRLLRLWARPRRVRRVLVAQRCGVSGGDSHSMGPVGPEGKSLRKSPGQSP